MQSPPKESSSKATINGNTKNVQLTRRNTNLKACPIFNNLVFSDISLEYLDLIESHIESAGWLSNFLPITFISSMFVKKPGGRAASGYKINSAFGFQVKKAVETAVTSRPAPHKALGARLNGNNWVVFAEAMGGISDIKRAAVEKEATLAILALEFDGYSKHRDEIKFFKAIEDGCIP